MHPASDTPLPDTPVTPVSDLSGSTPKDCDGDFWYALIKDEQAGEFLKLTTRGLENFRRTGEGPRYVRISCRCVRYRRIDLKAWADALLRSSTSDDGSQAA